MLRDPASTTWIPYASPIGRLTLQRTADGLCAVRFPGRGGPLDEAQLDPDGFDDIVAQLEAYFAGAGTGFSIPLDLGGTPAQRAVWAALQRIPAGTTTGYGELAGSLGRPSAVRAVAAAVGKTPTPIVVPCHRVVGADGALTGYLGGLERKAALLELEGVELRVRGDGVRRRTRTGAPLSIKGQDGHHVPLGPSGLENAGHRGQGSRPGSGPAGDL